MVGDRLVTVALGLFVLGEATLHKATLLQAGDEARHSRPGDERLLGEADEPHLVPRCARQEQQDLVLAEAEPVVARELGVELTCYRGMRPQILAPDLKLLVVRTRLPLPRPGRLLTT